MNIKGDPKKDKDDLLRECRELADADAADALKSGHSSEHEYFIALSGRITAALAEPQGDGWIKCSERLPEDGVTVIVAGGIAQLRGINWYSLTGIEYPGRPIQWEVTHWRPLPPLPKE